ncbi:MAG: hypothetical protein V3R80_08710, partial [Candidatus Tectomicrobia bacterium]
IDTSTWQVVKKISISLRGVRKHNITPKEIELTRDGKLAFVALGRANHVVVIDAPTYTVRKFLLVGGRPWGMALSSDEGTLYVANGTSNDVSIIDVGKLKATKSVPTGRFPWTVVVDD